MDLGADRCEPEKPLVFVLDPEKEDARPKKKAKAKAKQKKA